MTLVIQKSGSSRDVGTSWESARTMKSHQVEGVDSCFLAGSREEGCYLILITHEDLINVCCDFNSELGSCCDTRTPIVDHD